MVDVKDFGDWDEGYWPDSIGSLHSIGDYQECTVVHQRPIGFLTNIDRKPVYRVPAKSRKI